MKTVRDAVSHVVKAVIILVSVVIVVIVLVYLPVTYQDWVESFRPAALSWENPYQGLTFNPPWLFLLLYPLAILPARVGAGLLMFISFVIIAGYVRSPIKTLLVSLSAPMIVLLTLGNIDGLIVLGLLLPYGISLPFLMIKPQGVFIASLKRISFWSILMMLLMIGASIFIWGFWWKDITTLSTPVSAPYNVSSFPYSVIPGLLLLIYGLRKKSDALLCYASLCFSPYFMITSLLPAVAASLRETRRKWIWAAVILGSWGYYFLMK
jgi:hypothetical protein